MLLYFVRPDPSTGHDLGKHDLPVDDTRSLLDRPKHQWQESAINGRSVEPFAMAAYGSESGRSDDALQTASFDSFRTFL